MKSIIVHKTYKKNYKLVKTFRFRKSLHTKARALSSQSNRLHIISYKWVNFTKDKKKYAQQPRHRFWPKNKIVNRRLQKPRIDLPPTAPGHEPLPGHIT